MIPTTPNERYRGMRYLNLLRCSDLSQADTSPDGQKAVNDTFCQGHEMVFVDDLFLEGVSGSQTFNRSDIDAIILRKQERDDFDAVVVFELSRLTRGGTRHGWSIEDRLRKAGIEVISSTDAIPEGPEGDLVKSAKHYANQVQARGISLGVARGLAQSLARQSRPGASRTPYGCDRLYRGPDGRPRMLTRWEGKTQLWFSVDEQGNPIDEIGRRVKPSHGSRRKDGRRERFRGYVKQADETSELVAGSGDRQDALVLMFTAYDLWGWGYHRVVNKLNRDGIPAPEGGRWTITTVRNILFNPIYLGIEVRHRYTAALFHKLAPNGPKPVSVDQDKLEREGRSQVPQVERPREEWRLVDVPRLKDMLPEDLRAVALQRILRRLDPDRPAHPKKGKPIHLGEGARHRHQNSPYLLTHLLRSKQTGHLMRSETSNRRLKGGPKTYRYYFDGTAAVFAENGITARRLRAEPLEHAVLDVVQRFLAESDDLEEQIRAAVEASDRVETEPDRTADLEAERDRLVNRLREGYRLLGDLKDGVIVQDMERDRHRLEETNRKLAQSAKDTPSVENIDEIVGSVRKRLTKLTDYRDHMPATQIKTLLAAVIEDLTVDLETRELTFTLVLPHKMLTKSDGQNADVPVRLDSPWPWP